jgi:hypothetical protein
LASPARSVSPDGFVGRKVDRNANKDKAVDWVVIVVNGGQASNLQLVTVYAAGDADVNGRTRLIAAARSLRAVECGAPRHWGCRCHAPDDNSPIARLTLPLSGRRGQDGPGDSLQ